MGADDIGGGLQVDRFALGETAANLYRNLKRQADRAAPFWVSCSMHKRAFGDRPRVPLKMLPRM